MGSPMIYIMSKNEIRYNKKYSREYRNTVETQILLINKIEKHCRTQNGRMGYLISENKEMLATLNSQQALHHTPLHD
jgi:hypothetical protein